MKLTVDKSPWLALKKSFAKAETLENRLGWFEENRYGPDNDNLPMAQVAQWQEEGTEGGQGNGSGIPPRPFMRVGLKAALLKGSDKGSFKRILTEVAMGRDVFKILRKEGVAFEDTLKDVMRAWDTPGNADSTIAQKGFDDPLNETGQLISNVTSKTAKRGT
jgi:hypothetical protein